MKAGAYKKLKAAMSANPGALHRKLGVPEGQKIPQHLLTEALHSSNPTEKKEAVLARTMRGFKKK